MAPQRRGQVFTLKNALIFVALLLLLLLIYKLVFSSPILGSLSNLFGGG